jgi:hypothetical protein
MKRTTKLVSAVFLLCSVGMLFGGQAASAATLATVAIPADGNGPVACPPPYQRQGPLSDTCLSYPNNIGGYKNCVARLQLEDKYFASIYAACQETWFSGYILEYQVH